jgi:hypothetical protein
MVGGTTLEGLHGAGGVLQNLPLLPLDQDAADSSGGRFPCATARCMTAEGKWRSGGR